MKALVLVLAVLALSSCVTVAGAGLALTTGHVVLNDAHKVKEMLIELKKLKGSMK